ncbi:unnamed protein product, partial [Polarella glacialis]
MDLGVCFTSSGSVQAVNVHFASSSPARAAGQSLLFLGLEPSGDEVWVVRAASVSESDSLTKSTKMRLQLKVPLPVLPGHCLGWYRQAGSAAISFAPVAPAGSWFTPSGLDSQAISASARVHQAPQLSQALRFSEVHYRRYALQAEVLPGLGTFAAHALLKLGHSAPQSASGQPGGSAELLDETEVQTACWAGGLTPEQCCVPAGVGVALCFDARYTHAVCCSAAAAGAKAAFNPAASKLKLPQRPKLLDRSTGSPRSAPDVSVDLFVRTFHGKLQELTHLLQSVALFWPSNWGVIIVLDGDSAADAAACELMPSWTRCILQTKPPFFEELKDSYGSIDFHGQGRERHRGLVWKEWSECWADLHSSADFIAVSDSDVVLTTFGLPQLLFQDGPEPRPVLWAHADNIQFPAAVEALQIPWQAEFMDSFPLVVKRRHFGELRKRIVKLFGGKAAVSSQNPGDQEPLDNNNTSTNNNTINNNNSFDWAFASYVREVQMISATTRGAQECPSFHSMMGSFLFEGYRDEYVWSIRHGHITDVPLKYTCPRLRVAHHVAYWGRENWMSYAGYPFKHLKVGGRPPALSETAYAARATALILAGLCAALGDVQHTWALGECERLGGRGKETAGHQCQRQLVATRPRARRRSAGPVLAWGWSHGGYRSPRGAVAGAVLSRAALDGRRSCALWAPAASETLGRVSAFDGWIRL